MKRVNVFAMTLATVAILAATLLIATVASTQSLPSSGQPRFVRTYTPAGVSSTGDSSTAWFVVTQLNGDPSIVACEKKAAASKIDCHPGTFPP